MDIHLIASDTQRLNALVQQIGSLPTAQARSIATTLCRAPHQALSPLVAALGEGLLLLEADASAQDTDWAELARLTAQHPRLNVVLMSNDAHKEVLLSAMRAGVRELIPCPPDVATLQATLQRWAQPQDEAQRSPGLPTRPRGQLIAFMACKGGAGSTFLATSLAHLLATEFDRPCALIDLDLLYGDASFYLGQTAHPNSIADLATPADRLDTWLLASCMHTVTPGLQILSAPPDMAAATTLQTQHIAQILALACTEHPLVVVDLPRSLEPRCMAALAAADVVYLVMDNTLAALRDAQRGLQFLRNQGVENDRIRLVLNQHTREAALDPATVQAALGMPVRHRIPAQGPAVNECINLGQAMAQRHPHNPVTAALREVAADLLQRPAPSASGWLRPWLKRWLSRSSGHPSDHASGRSSDPRAFNLSTPGVSLETRQP